MILNNPLRQDGKRRVSRYGQLSYRLISGHGINFAIFQRRKHIGTTVEIAVCHIRNHTVNQNIKDCARLASNHLAGELI
ncbi:hypothetical protein SDC9_202706 [bioreactor metagenome]|uniref:Uncharacterized protein n=1 Tax=bioreactor metagenome TaxID=1076179 RepID=A0A645IV56_9ZZZZ